MSGTQTCDYLILGADINAVTRTLPATPLRWAALQGLSEVVHLLIHRCTDPHFIDAQGYGSPHATHSLSYWFLLAAQYSTGRRASATRSRRAYSSDAARTRTRWTAMGRRRCTGRRSAGTGGCIGQLLAAGAQLHWSCKYRRPRIFSFLQSQTLSP
ncbi:hypothetical protein EDB86DRAFT_1015977 [Lactarius hatsudake]|nr:hypothetical protein EDB86DRAFT_1015977 [Lactarius hatsudake]